MSRVTDLLMPLSRRLVSRLSSNMQNSYAHAHTRSQASSMQAKTLPSTHSFRHEWCMATSWSNSPHVRHAGTFACLHCIHRSVFVGWRLLCYTPAPCIILSDSLEQSWTHTHTNSRNPDFGCGQILVTLTNLVAS